MENKQREHTSFVDFLEKGDVFYWVNVELHQAAREYSRVDLFEYIVTDIDSETISLTKEAICGGLNDGEKLSGISIEALARKDYMGDDFGGLKRTYAQAMRFLEAYAEQFVWETPLIDNTKRLYALSFMEQEIEKISLKMKERSGSHTEKK